MYEDTFISDNYKFNVLYSKKMTNELNKQKKDLIYDFFVYNKLLKTCNIFFK